MAKKEVKPVSSIRDKVSRFKEFLRVNRFHSTINRLRREKVRSLEVLNKGAILDTKDLKHIKFIGLKKFSLLEVNEIQTITTYTFKKLRRNFPRANLTVNIKRHEKAGKRCKYTVNYKLNRGTKLYASAKQDDWELPRALHKALKNLEQEVKHKYKLEGKRRR
jgi:hypothetical protein